MLKATIEGKELVIRVPLNATPGAPASGKTLVVASGHGNQKTEAVVNGQQVIVASTPTSIGRSNSPCPASAVTSAAQSARPHSAPKPISLPLIPG
jgi:hypothetical protein